MTVEEDVLYNKEDKDRVTNVIEVMMTTPKHALRPAPDVSYNFEKNAHVCTHSYVTTVIEV
jgi:hypothetical protein